ncbi:MAG: hypothetical protein HYV28_00475 [Ignavibacteriales bacterium]|nr:hypothetical protein [Ignavibacteriales bacterium]
MNKYRAIASWQSVYHNPLMLKQGDRITIDWDRVETDSEWHGWVWGKTSNNEGWIPEQLVQLSDTDKYNSSGIMIKDYSAKEHDVCPGEIVTGEKILNGWLWCTKIDYDDYGWLPLKVLTITG